MPILSASERAHDQVVQAAYERLKPFLMEEFQKAEKYFPAKSKLHTYDAWIEAFAACPAKCDLTWTDLVRYEPGSDRYDLAKRLGGFPDVADSYGVFHYYGDFLDFRDALLQWQLSQLPPRKQRFLYSMDLSIETVYCFFVTNMLQCNYKYVKTNMELRPKSSNELLAQHQDVELYGHVIDASTLEVAQYLAALRNARKQREAYYTGPIRQFTDVIPLPLANESRMVEQLRSRVVRTTDPERARAATERRFPSGTFMFHGAKTGSMVKILRSGYLMNARALGDKKDCDDNGGEEGISWSLGNIDALPGSRFHLAGFMAAPETLLGEGRDQLAIPDSPAPYEVVQLSSNIDAQDFYRKYTQARQLEVEYDAICEAMENGDSTVEVQADELEAQIMAIADELRGNLCAQNDVRVPIEKLYMVVPEKDLEDWLRVLVRCASKPAGIVAYDDTTVRLEDFASDHKGDGDELARQLRGIVGETAETLTYADVLGSEFNDSMRYGDANQLIGPKYLANTKRIVMENGKLVVKE